MAKANVLDKVMLLSVDTENYLSITDIAKYKNSEAPADIVKNWLRSKNTIELLGLWERIHNPDFKLIEFDQFKNEAGYNHFVLFPKKWIESTSAIGLISKSGFAFKSKDMGESDSHISRFELSKGDILIAMTGAGSDRTHGKIRSRA